MGFAIGVDVGSQSVKGVLIDPAGAVCGEAGSPVSIVHPAPAWAEQDPHSWEAALEIVVRQLVERARLTPGDVSVLCLACQVDSVVPVDAGGEPVGPAIIWLDRRAGQQVERLCEEIGTERLQAITGLVADPSHTGPKIAWLREHRPDVATAAVAFPPAAGYLVQRLTGRLVIDHANASSSLMYDVDQRAWSPELMTAVGVTADQLGEICDAGDVAGTLTGPAARRLGLTTDCSVLVGTGDDHAGAIGAGVIAPGLIGDMTGTAEPVTTCSPTAVRDTGALVETHCHAVPGQYLIENPGFVSGGSILWLAGGVLDLSQGDVLALAGTCAPGAEGVLFLPALSGSMAPRWNGDMRGAFAGLSMATSRAALARAVVEGCCFALRDVTDRFAAMGLRTSEIRVVGGGSRSQDWLQIKADVTGQPVRAVRVVEATALGAALLAAVGAGTFASLAEGVTACVVIAPEPIRPRPETADLYSDAYQRYRRLYDGVEGALA